MAPAHLRIRQATEADIPRIIESQFSAFEGDPYQEALFPSDDYYSAETRQGAVDRTVKYWNTDPTARWMVAYDTQDEAEEQILGFALWNIYEHFRPESEWKKQPEVDWCEGRQRDIALNFLNMNARLRQRIWEGRPYVLLNLLCIHQDFQRRGAGTALVEWGMEVARSLGLAIHLEASAAGYELYRKLGFKQVDVAIVKKEEWDGDHDRRYIAMVKEPEATSTSTSAV